MWILHGIVILAYAKLLETYGLFLKSMREVAMKYKLKYFVSNSTGKKNYQRGCTFTENLLRSQHLLKIAAFKATVDMFI